ncbi:MAG: FAD-dependent oxidoreductase [Oscillospiraceae bacterium]|nr:FAD-dependent oxidoreductase [Oscillospiraceae bacterium]
MDSLWTETAQLPSFPQLHSDIKTDALVIGGGLAGLLCAYKLKQAGIDHVVLEASRICGGITKNTTAKITSQHGMIYSKLTTRFSPELAELYLRANEEALGEYTALCAHIACGFESKDSLVYSNSPGALNQELRTLHRFGFDAEFAISNPLPMPTAGAVLFHNQAQFHPLEFAAEIAKDLHIYEHTPVRELAGCTAVTDHGRVSADKIIVATHFPFLNKHGLYFLKMYQQRSYVLALENAQDVGGMYIGAEDNSLSFRNYGNLLLLGGGGHRTGKQGGNWAELEQFAQQHYPEAKTVYRWATQDCMTLDGLPYIGQYSKNTPNLFVATGFNKWGMTISMAAANILCDLVKEKQNPYADLFSPSRSMLHKQLLVNAGETTVNLLSFSKKRCPHLGCALKWNAQEHSWDCPCHGSRFTKSGKLIDNPATGDLKKP